MTGWSAVESAMGQTLVQPNELIIKYQKYNQTDFYLVSNPSENFMNMIDQGILSVNVNRIAKEIELPYNEFISYPSYQLISKARRKFHKAKDPVKMVFWYNK